MQLEDIKSTIADGIKSDDIVKAEREAVTCKICLKVPLPGQPEGGQLSQQREI